MKYAFKMIAVVLALGVLVLQGCQTGRNSKIAFNSTYVSDVSVYKPTRFSRINNNDICNNATTLKNGKRAWISSNISSFVKEAKSRGLDCGVGGNNKTIIASKPKTKTYTKPKSTISLEQNELAHISNSKICNNFYKYRGNTSSKHYINRLLMLKYKNESIRRGLNCGVGDNKTVIASNIKINLNETLKSFSNYRLCPTATIKIPMKEEYRWDYRSDYSTKAVFEAKRRGLDCGVGSNNKTITASKTKTYTQPKSNISSAELNAANKRAKELERKLASLQSKQKQEQQKIDTDTRVPLLEIISIKTKGKRGTITGIARDNIEVAEVTIDGKPVSLSSNGNFKYSTYVPAIG